MTALVIIAVIVLLLFALLMLKIWLTFDYCYGDKFRMRLKIGFVRKEYVFFSADRDDTEEGITLQRIRKTDKADESGKSLGVRQTLSIIKEVTAEIYRKAKKSVRLEKYVLKITVASDDPAKTALVYAAAAGIAASLWRFVEGIKNKSKKKQSIYSEVRPDFIADKPDMYVSIAISARVWQGLSLLTSLSKGLNKYKTLKAEKGDSHVRHTS